MNEFSHYWSPFHANDCVFFSRNEQQKVYVKNGWIQVVNGRKKGAKYAFLVIWRQGKNSFDNINSEALLTARISCFVFSPRFVSPQKHKNTVK